MTSRRIVRVQTFQYLAEWTEGAFRMSGSRVATGHPSLVVRVETDDGLVGWGETCPNGPTYLESFFEGESAAAKILGDAVLGVDPAQLGRIGHRLDSTLRGSNAAKAAIDVACWDLLGKALDLPISDLLGGALQDSIPTWAALPIEAPERLAARALEALGTGAQVFQVKVGDSPRGDVERVRAVLDTVGPDAVVIADANGGWTLQDALLVAESLRATGIRLEQPCRSLADCAEVRRHTSLPLIIDESVASLEDLLRAHKIGATGINLKISKVGGLTRARAMRDLAQALRLTFTVDDTWGGSLATAAITHLARSCEPALLVAATRFSDWITPRIGSDVIGAGLGLMVDEDLLHANPC